jgi:hypothetical protein
VIVANTRRYANVVEVAPGAYLDDGLLDVLVITGGNPLTTIEQLASLFLQHKPGDAASKVFRASQISIRVPASVHLHLDGSAVDLKDYLNKAEQQALQQVKDMDHVMVNYQFTAEPHALQMAIPRTYDNTLFQHAPPQDTSQQQKNADTAGTKDVAQQQPVEFVGALTEHGYKVRVVGVAPNPDRPQTYIIAGNIHKEQTEETEPVAVRVDATTPIVKQTGEHLPVAAVEKLQEGEEIVVGGKRSKRGVARATHIVI